jgi:hypothetical protein
MKIVELSEKKNGIPCDRIKITAGDVHQGNK